MRTLVSRFYTIPELMKFHKCNPFMKWLSPKQYISERCNLLSHDCYHLYRSTFRISQNGHISGTSPNYAYGSRFIMTSSNGNIFRVTGHLCGEFIHRSPVNFPHKGQRRGALMFSLICSWIPGWVNNSEAGDLGRHCVHYDVSVMYVVVGYCLISSISAG